MKCKFGTIKGKVGQAIVEALFTPRQHFHHRALVAAACRHLSGMATRLILGYVYCLLSDQAVP
jgi:hypothetical protein